MEFYIACRTQSRTIYFFEGCVPAVKAAGGAVFVQLRLGGQVLYDYRYRIIIMSTVLYACYIVVICKEGMLFTVKSAYT